MSRDDIAVSISAIRDEISRRLPMQHTGLLLKTHATIAMHFNWLGSALSECFGPQQHVFNESLGTGLQQQNCLVLCIYIKAMRP